MKETAVKANKKSQQIYSKLRAMGKESSPEVHNRLYKNSIEQKSKLA